jgi:hypothetical protein
MRIPAQANFGYCEEVEWVGVQALRSCPWLNEPYFIIGYYEDLTFLATIALN